MERPLQFTESGKPLPPPTPVAALVAVDQAKLERIKASRERNAKADAKATLIEELYTCEAGEA